MNKHLIVLLTLSLMTSPVMAKGGHHHETSDGGDDMESHGHSHLSAKLTPFQQGQFGLGTIRYGSQNNHAHTLTSLDADISLPLGLTLFNIDSIAQIETLTVTLTNANASLNCNLSPTSVAIQPVSGGTGYTAFAHFKLHQVAQDGQAPIHVQGSCLAYPSSLSSGDNLTVTVLSGSTLLTTLTGTLK